MNFFYLYHVRERKQMPIDQWYHNKLRVQQGETYKLVFYHFILYLYFFIKADVFLYIYLVDSCIVVALNLMLSASFCLFLLFAIHSDFLSYV